MRLKNLISIYSILVLILLSACASRSHSLSRHLLEGNDAAMRGDYSTAVLMYENALKKSPDSVAAKRNLGIVLVKVGNYSKAKSILMQIENSYPNDVDVFYHLGEAHRGLNDFGTAVYYYQRALRIDSKDIRVVKALAWSWHKTRYYEKTLTTLQPYLEKHPEDLQLRLILASTYNRLKMHKKALETLEPIERAGFKLKSKDKVTAESEKALLLTALGDAYYGSDNIQKASTLYSEVLKNRPFLSSALVGAARCDLSKNSQEKAVQKLQRAAKSDPDNADAHYLLGKLYEKADPVKSTFYFKRFLLLSKFDVDYANEVRDSRTALSALEKAKGVK